jgi:hypothetical protein
MNRFVMGQANAYLVVMVEKAEDTFIFHSRPENRFIVGIRDYLLAKEIHEGSDNCEPP